MSDEMATVRVWSDDPLADYDTMIKTCPTEYELPIVSQGTYVPHDKHVLLADCIDHHGKYAFDVEADRDVLLIIQTSDRYHDTVAGFREGRPVEGGLLYLANAIRPPFRAELWGCVRMRVEGRGR